MSKSTSKKTERLGVPYGTACHRLRKMVLFDVVKKAGLDTCHKCGEKIERLEEFSIEHKEAWLNSDDPVGLFFDMDNIAFSHHSCNVAGRKIPIAKHGKASTYSLGCRCGPCTKANSKKVRNWRALRV